jgi:hypothetical protein
MGAVKHCRVQKICRARRGFQSCLDRLPPSEQEELTRYVRSHNTLVARRLSACSCLPYRPSTSSNGGLCSSCTSGRRSSLLCMYHTLPGRFPSPGYASPSRHSTTSPPPLPLIAQRNPNLLTLGPVLQEIFHENFIMRRPKKLFDHAADRSEDVTCKRFYFNGTGTKSG